MKFKEDFINKIKKYNGQNVHLKIIQIDATNHPLGQMGAMMMGEEQSERINKAMRTYNGKNGIIEMNAFMEFVTNSAGEKLIFLNNSFECNCIEVFRPDPPMIIEGIDMSLSWSFHPLSESMVKNQLTLLKNEAKVLDTLATGDSHAIRDIIVNGMPHCL
jgi:hypothetical protein